MEVKDLVYNQDGTIDLKLNHPNYGWIPFTASKDDCEAHGRLIFKNAINGKYGEILPATE